MLLKTLYLYLLCLLLLNCSAPSAGAQYFEITGHQKKSEYTFPPGTESCGYSIKNQQ